VYAKDTLVSCLWQVGPIAPISAGFGWNIVTVRTSGTSAQSQSQNTSLVTGGTGCFCPWHRNLACVG